MSSCSRVHQIPGTAQDGDGSCDIHSIHVVFVALQIRVCLCHDTDVTWTSLEDNDVLQHIEIKLAFSLSRVETTQVACLVDG